MSEPRPVQLTVRAAIVGMLLGGVLSLSNLYVVLKTGWSFGVTITAGILAFLLFRSALRVGVVKRDFGVLENNAMQSVASAAGYMTGGGTAAAIPAVMMLTGERMEPFQMFAWITAIAFLGVVMAIPMKQQMIDVEQLRFPSGIAAAETLQALHAAGAGAEKGVWLAWSAVAGAVVAFFRDFQARFMPFNLPEKIALPGTLRGRPLADFSLSFEASLLLVAGGAIMGWRSAWSLLVGAIVNFAVLAPELYARGILPDKLGYKNIVGWSVWFGSAMLLTSGLVAFAFQWRTVVRAMQSVATAFRGAASDDGQVPMIWFVIGMAVFGPIVVLLEWLFFGIHPWLGVISVALGFFTAIVACRVTGETDTTPSGALGKITQVTFGVLAPGNVVTNLMTANVTAGVGLHAADLLTDLKSGYLLKADPRQQFWGQFLGVVAGSAFVVPAFYLLIPDASELGGDKWPVPGAQTWKGVAELLAKGFSTLHVSAQIALVVGAVLGVALVLLERWFPKAKPYFPSATGLGLAFTLPAYNSFSMFLGALVALVLEKRNKALAERTIVPVSSGLIAGESLMGVFIAATFAILGLLGISLE